MDPMLDYASPKSIEPTPGTLKIFYRRSRTVLVVRDPWTAVIAAFQLELAIYLLQLPDHHQSMIGNERWSFFAWCWRFSELSYTLTWSPILAAFLLTASCLSNIERTWAYGIYVLGGSIFFAANVMATAYLNTQLQGVWKSCRPLSIFYFGWPILILLNPGFFFLLFRFIMPSFRFVGPVSYSTPMYLLFNRQLRLPKWYRN